MGNTQVITVKLPGELVKQLERRSKQTGHGRSALVREAIEKSLREGDGDAAPRSFFTIYREFAGCFAGPGDLSYAKRHLKGFGRKR